MRIIIQVPGISLTTNHISFFSEKKYALVQVQATFILYYYR